MAADRFDVTGLKKVTECDLANSLDAENALQTLALFDQRMCETKGLENRALRLVPSILGAIYSRVLASFRDSKC